ncbi:SGNH/GDSL hydrolase family protein [Rhodobacteraceae bacterium 63075]|nr:SGNH/GDSL hydrolase family protein [Rhodobacteraceae bacterium 63075]
MLRTLALSPLLAAQAAFVIARAERLPEPEGPRTGEAGQGPALRLLILGDSSAAGVGARHQSVALSGRLAARLAESFALTWQLEARTGATSASALATARALPGARFDVALVALGVNDVTRFVSARRFRETRRALHEVLRARFGVGRIVSSGLPPMGQFPLLPRPLRSMLGQKAVALDAALAELCAEDAALTHVPLDLPFEPHLMASDGFHPSEAAYAHWADMLAPHLRA